MRRVILLLLLALGICHQAAAAKITKLVQDGKNFIFVEGTFLASDIADFKKLAVEFDTAVVVFNSTGGAALVGTEIGRIISLRGYSTAVGPNAVCASSCALAWLAGQERYVWKGARVGFHAIYVTPNGTPTVSSDGNALVGAYLRQLGFPDRTIVYITQTSPTSIQWLTPEDAKQYGIAFSYIAPPTPSDSDSASDGITYKYSMYGRNLTDIPLPSPRPDYTPALPTIVATAKAFFYEEQIEGSPLAVPGTVEWKISEKSFSDGWRRKTIVGLVKYPERSISVSLSIEPNDDSTLPASHVISLLFTLPAGYQKGTVLSVPRIALKATEQQRGESLIGVPARLTDYLHIVALNDDPEARLKNITLLAKQGWLDIPVTFTDNTRALITLEKGEIGEQIFENVLLPTMAVSK